MIERLSVRRPFSGDIIELIDSRTSLVSMLLDILWGMVSQSNAEARKVRTPTTLLKLCSVR